MMRLCHWAIPPQNALKCLEKMAGVGIEPTLFHHLAALELRTRIFGYEFLLPITIAVPKIKSNSLLASFRCSTSI